MLIKKYFISCTLYFNCNLCFRGFHFVIYKKYLFTNIIIRIDKGWYVIFCLQKMSKMSIRHQYSFNVLIQFSISVVDTFFKMFNSSPMKEKIESIFVYVRRVTFTRPKRSLTILFQTYYLQKIFKGTCTSIYNYRQCTGKKPQVNSP